MTETRGAEEWPSFFILHLSRPLLNVDGLALRLLHTLQISTTPQNGK